VILFADAGGLPGNAYDMTVAGATETCTSDAYEPNDTDSAAVPLTDGNYPGLFACSGDDDWYELTLLGGEAATIELAFSDAEGDIDAYFWDPTVTSVLTSGETTDDDEVFSYPVVIDGTYYVQVALIVDSGSVPGNPYEMTVTSAPTCAPDAYEPNDSIGAATSIPIGNTAGATVCELEPDYYSFNLNTGDNVTVGINFPHAEGDLDLFLYDDLGVEVASSDSVSDDEVILYTALGAGTYTIGVFNVDDTGPVPGNAYDIDLAVSLFTCSGDVYEPNDDAAEAGATANGFYGGLTVCEDVFDWYAFTVSAGDIIRVDIDFSHAEGDLDLYIHDTVGSTVASAISTSDNESLLYTVATGGVHYAEVALLSDDGPQPGNRYDLDLTAYSATCPTDFTEPNDTDSTADGIEPPGYQNMYVCSDDDWYSVNAPSGIELEVQLSFDHDEGDIDVFLYDAGLGLLESGETSDDDEEVFADTTSAGTYYVQVVLFSDTGPAVGNVYDLTISGPVTSTCPSDFLEPNDSLATARPTGLTDLNTNWACSGDDDYYSAYLFAGETLDVLVEFYDDEGDIDIALLDSTGAPLQTSETSDDEETVFYTATETGFVYLQVYLFADAGITPGSPYITELALVP